jgi:hypothetical protein
MSWQHVARETVLAVSVVGNVGFTLWHFWRIRTLGRLNDALFASLMMMWGMPSPQMRREVARFMDYQRRRRMVDDWRDG